jgi:hypothetical protein
MLHWNMRNKSISYLQLKRRELPQGVTITAEIAGVDFVDFADKFNRYIDYYNQTAKKQHKIQAMGYWVATAVALFSLAITLIG